MEILDAKKLIESYHFQIARIERIPEGFNHYVFDIILQNGLKLIAKIRKQYSVGQRDTLFDGIVSSKRESAICEIVRNKAKLPAPKIYLQVDSEQMSFLVTEKLPGITWRQYLQKRHFSKESFLQSIYYLGEDIAKLQQVTFKSFGDIVDEETVLPKGIYSFTDRFLYIMNVRITRASQQGLFTKSEVKQLKDFFAIECKNIADFVQTNTTKPVMIFTDMHPDNFLVDDIGKPSGYFDLDACQAAPPSLEFYGLKLFLFSYFDQEYFHLAEEAFFRGYEKQGGIYDRFNPTHIQLENLLTIGRILELSTSYFQIKDGLRDTWSYRFKILLWQSIEEKKIDYQAIGEIFREKTKQPKMPN